MKYKHDHTQERCKTVPGTPVPESTTTGITQVLEYCTIVLRVPGTIILYSSTWYYGSTCYSNEIAYRLALLAFRVVLVLELTMSTPIVIDERNNLVHVTHRLLGT